MVILKIKRKNLEKEINISNWNKRKLEKCVAVYSANKEYDVRVVCR